jgi:hypothetical protein
MVLGELIVEDKGKITGQRVLDANGPKIETSMTTVGTYRGTEATEIATYWSIPQEDGIMYGEGEGVITTKDGQEMATWTGQGVGKSTAGKIRFCGSIFFKASLNGGKLSFLNNLVGVFEFEADEQGNCSSKVWEWK